MSEHIDPAETEALFAFMKATVTRVEKGGLGTENALISVALLFRPGPVKIQNSIG